MTQSTVNGEPSDLRDGSTIADVVSEWCSSSRGVAVARNGEVVPRSLWDFECVHAGDRIEIVSAAAGG
ncbi:MAG: sulfur carrier protein ThiS [Acidimicrobiales bacterium]